MAVIGDIQKHYNKIFAAEKKVADFILNNPGQTVMSNVSELASLSGVSDATVIRLCKHIGYEGYYQMKLILSNELGRTQIADFSKVEDEPKSPIDLFQIVSNNLMSLASEIDMSALNACVDLIMSSKFVHVIAVGNTCPISADLAFRLGRLGIRTTTSMVQEYFLNNLILATKDDLLIGISHSGSSTTVIRAFELAKAKGIKTIAISSSQNSPIAKLSDYMLLSPCSDRIFVEYAITSHIFEFAVVDLLLYYITKRISAGEEIDQVEMMLAETKL